MSDLIKALQIFLKYDDKEHPTHCEHDVLMVSIDCRQVMQEDVEELDRLGFIIDEETDCFISNRFGSC